MPWLDKRQSINNNCVTYLGAQARGGVLTERQQGKVTLLKIKKQKLDGPIFDYRHK